MANGVRGDPHDAALRSKYGSPVIGARWRVPGLNREANRGSTRRKRHAEMWHSERMPEADLARAHLAARTDEHLERVAPGPARDEFLPFLLLADDSEQQVRSYYQHGDLFVLRGGDGTARGTTLALRRADGSTELKSVAVLPELQGQGVGQRMLALVLAELRAAGVRRVTVGTASCSIGELAFYQKAGFRFWKVERDFFTPKRGYSERLAEHGIPLRDMVWLDQRL